MYRSIDRFFFIAGIIMIGPVIILGLLLNGGYLDFVHGYELCVFYNVTGLYCPGCGITRACFHLAEGRVIESFLYHVMPLSAVVVCSIYMIYLIRVRLILKKRGLNIKNPYPKDIENSSRKFHKRLEIAVYIVIGLMLLQWMLKDFLLVKYNIDWFLIISDLFSGC